MAAKVEQTAGAVHSTPAAKKDAKRALKRSRRKAEKIDPENAGKRRKDYIRGWVD